MKKKIIIIISVILVIILGFIVYFNTTFGSFSINETYYSSVLNEKWGGDPPEKALGEIKNSWDARNKAASVWLETYGVSSLFNWPYETLYDKIHDVWYVTGTLPSNFCGGTACILMRGSDGKILAVWHGK